MKKLIFFILMACLASQSLQALSIPKKSKFDPRIRFSVYNAKNVVSIFAKNGFVTVIEFAPNEQIINTATGFSDGWDIVDKGNLLFIKPKAIKTQLTQSNLDGGQEFVVDPNNRDWRTNLIVITNKNNYVFDLGITYHKGKNTYKLSFSYPQEELLKLEAMVKKQKKKAEANYIADKINRTTVPRNWDYLMRVKKGSENITPSYAYDDGVFTYLGFDNTKTFPSAFIVDSEGKESIVNSNTKKTGKYTVLIIHRMAKKILLRSGNKVVAIKNEGYGKNPLQDTREISNSNLKRTINKDIFSKEKNNGK